VADEAYDDTPNGARNGTRNGARRGWSGATKPDAEQTMIGITAGLSREFDDWFRSQYPDLKQLPSKDPYREKAFRIGLDALKKAFPPVPTFEERMAELDRLAS
jgi:hypothetical protein